MDYLNHKLSQNLPHLNASENTCLKKLKHKIRYAEEESNPGLLLEYLKLGDNSQVSSNKVGWECLLEQYQLLMSTIEDTSLPIHWRCLCLDHINRPLFALQELADCEKNKEYLSGLFYKLKVSSDKLQAELFA